MFPGPTFCPPMDFEGDAQRHPSPCPKAKATGHPSFGGPSSPVPSHHTEAAPTCHRAFDEEPRSVALLETHGAPLHRQLVLQVRAEGAAVVADAPRLLESPGNRSRARKKTSPPPRPLRKGSGNELRQQRLKRCWGYFDWGNSFQARLLLRESVRHKLVGQRLLHWLVWSKQ